LHQPRIIPPVRAKNFPAALAPGALNAQNTVDAAVARHPPFTHTIVMAKGNNSHKKEVKKPKKEKPKPLPTRRGS
jgi:hypothetical protein